MGAGVRRQQGAGPGLRAGAGARRGPCGHRRAGARSAGAHDRRAGCTRGPVGAGAGGGRGHHHGGGSGSGVCRPGGPGVNFDIVVTNAGGPPPGDFRDWDRDAWIKAVDANMLTPIELIKATVDGMAARGFGRIVNITSSAVKAPIDILGLSNGARSGLTGFVAGVARSGIAAKGVTINNLLPGKFDTDRIATTLRAAAEKTGKSVDDLRRAQQAQIPAGRYGTAEEFGAICAFLCSQQAAYLTGQNILPDGGAYPGTY